MAGDGRPRHCGRRADEAWPHGPYACLPRGGICHIGEPRSRRPVAAGSPPGHPAHRAAHGGAGQMQPHRQVPSRRAAAPGQTAVRRHCRSRGPGLRGGPGSRGKRPLRGKRRTCRVCYTPPASAATASGDVAAGRRGRIAGMTTLMLPADLAAVSSLPLAGQRAAPACRLYVAGSMASSPQPGGAEQPVLVASPSLVFSCTGRVACRAPGGSQIRALGRERSCRWPCRAVGGRASGLDVAAGPRSASQPGRGTWPGQSPALAGSRTARTVPARPARPASPLGWRSRSWFRPVATVAWWRVARCAAGRTRCRSRRCGLRR